MGYGYCYGCGFNTRNYRKFREHIDKTKHNGKWVD